MGSLPIALNVFAEPVSLLRLLGVETAGNALPLTTTCPLCAKPKLTIFEDTISGGAWHYCSACESAGDMIELAAAYWDMSPASTVERLAREGMPFPTQAVQPDLINRYIVSRPQTRNRFTAFWKNSQQYLSERNSQPLNVLKEVFRIYWNSTGERFRATLGRLLGANSRMAITQCFKPSTRPRTEGGFEHQVKPIFTGGEWTEGLVIPFYDVPDRITCFWLAVRRGDVTLRSPYTFTYGGGICEAGLAGIESVDWSGLPFGNRVIAVDCPALAVRIQARVFLTSTRPLPVVAWQETGSHRTKMAWRMLSGKKVIFWCMSLTAAAMHQAIITDGDVSIIRVKTVNTTTLDHYLRDGEIRDIARKIIRWALPWRAALAKWAETMPDGKVEELLLGLERYGHVRADLCEQSERLKAFIREPQYARTAAVTATANPLKITEFGGQWWYGPITRPQVWMNAILRIDALITKDDKPHYQGRLIMKNEAIPFEIRVDYLRSNNIVLHLSKLVADRGLGVLYVANGGGKQLLAAALAFQNPNGL